MIPTIFVTIGIGIFAIFKYISLYSENAQLEMEIDLLEGENDRLEARISKCKECNCDNAGK